MSEIKMGRILLNESSWLEFTIRDWKGENYACMRKFVDTDRYSGPTESGLNLHRKVLLQLLLALRNLRTEVPGQKQREFCRLIKSDEKEIVVCIIPPKDLDSLPNVDIRQYVDSPTYTGPTKKGIRFSWNRLDEIAELIKEQAEGLDDPGAARPTTPAPGSARPITGEVTVPKARDQVMNELMPKGPRKFPREFFDDSKKSWQTIQLPNEAIDLVQQLDGNFQVRSEFGFSRPVKNLVEGKFVVYAHARGERRVNVATEMIEVFRSVKAYENYLRDLKRSLTQAYLRKSGHRPTDAEHRVKDVFKSLGLPWISES